MTPARDARAVRRRSAGRRSRRSRRATRCTARTSTSPRSRSRSATACSCIRCSAPSSPATSRPTCARARSRCWPTTTSWRRPSCRRAIRSTCATPVRARRCCTRCSARTTAARTRSSGATTPGVGSYYGPFDAHHIFDQIPKGALETQPLKIDWTFWCYKCGGMASGRTCPHDDADRLQVSGTQLRKWLSEGSRGAAGVQPARGARDPARVLRGLDAPKNARQSRPAIPQGDRTAHRIAARPVREQLSPPRAWRRVRSRPRRPAWRRGSASRTRRSRSPVANGSAPSDRRPTCAG